jgi:hypothetical protein
MEHRWGQRVVTKVLVRVKGGPYGCAPGRLLNVSVSGALIETTLELPPATRIMIETATVIAGLESTCELRAGVVRAGSGVIGVEWLDFAPAPMVAFLAERSPVATPAASARKKAS